MLGYILRNGNSRHISSIATTVAAILPRDQAFSNLVEALQRAAVPTSNITQAIAATRHPDAESVLRAHLETVWNSPTLWLDDHFINWPAFDATCCIAHLIDLGVSPGELEPYARALSKHLCKGNCDSCSRFLHAHYAWMSRPEPLGVPF